MCTLYLGVAESGRRHVIAACSRLSTKADVTTGVPERTTNGIGAPLQATMIEIENGATVRVADQLNLFVQFLHEDDQLE